MTYERLDEALRKLKTDRERAEATENQRKRAGEEARIRFARIKSAVIGPIFDEVVARLVAEGFFGVTVDEQNDASGAISLDVNLSEDDGPSRQGCLQIRFNSDKHTCEFGKSTSAKTTCARARQLLTRRPTAIAPSYSIRIRSGMANTPRKPCWFWRR